MSNKAIVLEYLASNYPKWFDDDELSQNTQVMPRQQIYQICTNLQNEQLIDRMKIGRKLQNRWKGRTVPPTRQIPSVIGERSVAVSKHEGPYESWDEARFQDGLFQTLCQKIGEPRALLEPVSHRFELSTAYGGGYCEIEGELHLAKAGGTHKADVLINSGSQKLIAVEVKKFGSAVTDVFKARAYDAYHTKLAYGDRLDNVLVYFYRRGSKNTISIERAENLSHWYDAFIGVDLDQVNDPFVEPTNKVAEILSR